MSCDGTAWAIAQDGIAPTEKLVLILLADGGTADLARRSCLSPDELARTISSLVDAGLVRRGEGLRIWVAGDLSPSQDEERAGQPGRKKRRIAIFGASGVTCSYCGVRGLPMEIDHIVPRSRGGSNRRVNLAPSCGPCNRSKGAKLLSEWVRP